MVCLLQQQQCEHLRHQRKREAEAELDCLPLMKVLQVSCPYVPSLRPLPCEFSGFVNVLAALSVPQLLSGVPEMTEEEEFEAVQHEAEAAAEEALHTSRGTVDTPARNTRARQRIPALPVPVAQGQFFFQFHMRRSQMAHMHVHNQLNSSPMRVMLERACRCL